MTPGFKTSEGRLTALHSLVTVAIAVCALFGWGTPAWLKPDAPWIGTAALLAGVLVTAVYAHGRVTLKAVLAQLETKTAPQQGVKMLPPLSTVDVPAVPTVSGPDSGYGLVEVAFALVLVVIALILLLTFIHH